MTRPLTLAVDRSNKLPISEQIRAGIERAIGSGALQPGARLPSWRDLAAQLGVARGTVRAAYERLQDAELIVATRTSGTRVVDRPRIPVKSAALAAGEDSSLPKSFRDLSGRSGIFQMGIPALDVFPLKLFSRLRARAMREELAAFRGYPDPCGEHALRCEIAAHLALSRSLECLPSQIIVTGGFLGALGLVLRVLQLEGQSVWTEEPCFPLTRRGLQLAQLTALPVPVDEEGLDVSYALAHAPDAALAVVTAGQQAPLGHTLSLARRTRLLEWAADGGKWIIEDDYLGELQLSGRAAPALASLDRAGRVIHIGSFSKTILPTLRLGFVVVPRELAPRFAEAAVCMMPAPGPAVQLATAEFMRGGHYLRHLRRMKRVYRARRDALVASLQAAPPLAARTAGLAVLMNLPDYTDDLLIARDAAAFGLAPAPLSVWYSAPGVGQPGLLLGVATAPVDRVAAAAAQLRQVIAQHAGRSQS